MSTTEKPKFPRAVALQVARELCAALTPACDRIIVAGSLRRRKQSVGDVEIVFVSKTGMLPRPGDMFANDRVSLAVAAIEKLCADGILAKRLNKLDSAMWGESNKLAVHVATGVPVDLFATTGANFWNYLVCRTGSADHNVKIASRAQDRGWKWNPYGRGFLNLRTGEIHPIASEQELFAFLGLPYVEPHER